MYGKRWGQKYSESVRREMSKDNIFAALIVISGFTFVLASRDM